MSISKIIHSTLPKMTVFGMSGTFINEKEIIRNTIYDTIKLFKPYREIYNNELMGWNIFERKDIFVKHLPKTEVLEALGEFERLLRFRYNHTYPISLIDDRVFDLFTKIRDNKFKITLKSNYSWETQHNLVRRLELHNYVDDYISSQYPYMIEELMWRNNIIESSNVINVCGTIKDLKEGKDSNCGICIGVLSGKEKREDFITHGADFVLENIMELENIFNI